MSNSTKAKLSWVFRVLLAILFLLSAVAKLYPSPALALGTFEAKQLIPMGFSEGFAAYFSRTLIGCELALGILLLLPHYFKKLVLPMSFLMLFIFTSHLTYEIMSAGNTGNCGCFGALLPMTPLQAVIKNVIAMGMLAFLFKNADASKDKSNFSFLMSITLASILLIYLVGPMKSSSTSTQPIPETEEESDTIQAPIPVIEVTPTGDTITKLVAPVEKQVSQPTPKSSGFEKYFLEIDKGKKVLCFFAPGCDHCQQTAKELTELKKKDPKFPKIKIIFMDEETDRIPEFFSFAGDEYPNKILDVVQFWKELGNTKDTPGVLYLWNGNVIKAYDGINENKFDKNAFKTLVNKTFEELPK
jgi:thiol-disulfide isomerase/thioredoxin